MNLNEPNPSRRSNTNNLGWKINCDSYELPKQQCHLGCILFQSNHKVFDAWAKKKSHPVKPMDVSAPGLGHQKPHLGGVILHELLTFAVCEKGPRKGPKRVRLSNKTAVWMWLSHPPTEKMVPWLWFIMFLVPPNLRWQKDSLKFWQDLMSPRSQSAPMSILVISIFIL